MSPEIAALLADIGDEPLADALRARGWLVTQTSAFKWERPCEFSTRHGYYAHWLSSRIKRGTKIPDFEADWSAGNGQGKRRLKWLRSNPDLEAWAKLEPPTKRRRKRK